MRTHKYNHSCCGKANVVLRGQLSEEKDSWYSRKEAQKSQGKRKKKDNYGHGWNFLRLFAAMSFSVVVYSLQ
jgi:hypothetical protein